MAPPPEGRVPWMARVTNSPGAQNCLEQFWTARARVRRTEAGKPQQIWTHFSAARRARTRDGSGNPSLSAHSWLYPISQHWTHFSAARRASAKDGAGNPILAATPRAWALFIYADETEDLVRTLRCDKMAG
ncbi:hypothetical protein AAY72_07920 [Alishewanella sp. WH16-1]|nr:hypothetical protein AAY72_07920 [Alishewanella sp. WH16-1]